MDKAVLEYLVAWLLLIYLLEKYCHDRREWCFTMNKTLLLLLAGVGLYLYSRQQAQAMNARPNYYAEDTGSDSRYMVSSIDDGYSGVINDMIDSVTSTVSNTWADLNTPEIYRGAIKTAEANNGLPDGLLSRLLYQESRFRSDIINGATRSSAGALGIAQFMPATAQQMGINPLDPFQAIPAAARYLRGLYDQFGTWQQALAAYNWGPGNVSRKGLTAAPQETQNYVAQITSDVPV
jgi:soluble lytic murein transglycosylase-like protein